MFIIEKSKKVSYFINILNYCVIFENVILDCDNNVAYIMNFERHLATHETHSVVLYVYGLSLGRPLATHVNEISVLSLYIYISTHETHSEVYIYIVWILEDIWLHIL